jgi:uncharacterized protein (DUF2062 family)
VRRLKIVLRRRLRRLLHLHDTPHAVALGASIGAFVGYGPLYGLHTVLAILLPALLRGNKAAALVMAWTNNPLTTVPILYAQYRLGSLLLPGRIPGSAWKGIKHLAAALHQISFLHFRESCGRVWEAIAAMGWDALWPTLVGSLVSSLVIALLVYPAALHAVIWRRHRVEARRAARHLRLVAEHQHHHHHHHH